MTQQLSGKPSRPPFRPFQPFRPFSPFIISAVSLTHEPRRGCAVISREVDVNPTDRWGATPLQDALRHRHTECAIALLNCGALQGNELSNTARGNHKVTP